MSKSSIEWTEVTWNPVTGCDRVSAGCDNCYALALSKRLKAMGAEKYQTDGNPVTSGPGFGVALHPESLNAPFKWKRPQTVFVNSMSDLFHAKVPLSFVQDVFAVMAETPQHTYQILTKRSRRLLRMADQLAWPSNVWMGVSVEEPKVFDRILDLAEVPAAVRFLSCEPLIAEIADIPLRGIDWVIAGGESGVRHRPMEAKWAESVRDQCISANIPFFFKQWGGRTPKQGGRVLDGRTWDELPVPKQRLSA
jgi:protein gp37